MHVDRSSSLAGVNRNCIGIQHINLMVLAANNLENARISCAVDPSYFSPSQ